MIYYLVTQQHPYTIDEYLQLFEPTLQNIFKRITYDGFVHVGSLPRGVYIFSDIERLGEVQQYQTLLAWQHLKEASQGICLLNHPQKSLKRYELLQKLYE